MMKTLQPETERKNTHTELAKRKNGHDLREMANEHVSNGGRLPLTRDGKLAKPENPREVVPSPGVSKVREVMARTALHLIGADRLRTPAMIGVTSTMQGEGRTTAALGLAIGIAEQTSLPTLLVEADLYRPVLTGHLGKVPARSINDYLDDTCSLSDAIVKSGTPHLSSIAAAGPSVDEQTGLDSGSRLTLLRKRLPQMLPLLREQFSYVVFDLPPVLEDINLEFVTRQLDGTFFVVRSGMATRDDVNEAFSLLDAEKVLGVLLTGEPTRVPRWVKQFVSS